MIMSYFDLCLALSVAFILFRPYREKPASYFRYSGKEWNDITLMLEGRRVM